MSKLTYVSLFSGGGVGCYGFKQEGFDCVVTNEIVERRLDVQKANNKCKYETGYIHGNITETSVSKKLFKEIENYKNKEKINDIDVVIATPPCQGMSVANHKKDNGDIYRNSLVVDAIKIVKKIQPKFFIFENVQSFLNTKCYENNKKTTISEVIKGNLSSDYEYHSEILNLKNYGANSSRTRTIVIGVRNDYADDISPIFLFPDYQKEKTLKQIISHLDKLNYMGETSEDDIYHNFKPYRKDMRNWICGIKQGESAFDNKKDINKPHQIIDGKLVINQNKNGDKYTRQVWDKVAPCVHTRNDSMASQNTVHPEEDRVFSIREVMIMMNIPEKFKWSNTEIEELNKLDDFERLEYLKKHEMNIRQCIGESIPTSVMRNIAKNIKINLSKERLNKKDINKLINNKGLENYDNLINYIVKNQDVISLQSLAKLAEISNGMRENTAAYYTELKTLNAIYKRMPNINKDNIRILEPSVGIGNFLPYIIKKYESYKSVTIDICDINYKSLEILKKLYENFKVPNNIKINIINKDFLKYDFKHKYDLVIGNPPFLRKRQSDGLGDLQIEYDNKKANNLSAFFMEKSLEISDRIILIQPKYFLHNKEFSIIRDKLSELSIDYILDFGESGFEGVLIETICLFIDIKARRNNVHCISTTLGIENKLTKKKLTDKKFPNWLIYRNDFFDKISKKLSLGIFTVFRDRQISNSLLNKETGIRVLKSRNLDINGNGIIDISGYDRYISNEKSKTLSVYQYLNRDDVFLVPNMTYYPRMYRKPKGTLVNGSVAILEKKDKKIEITESDLKYISSDEFREYYSIARNKSTRSLNIDDNSVYYFGKRKDKFEKS